MSEFGTGYAYCLGLFLCHDERRCEYKQRVYKSDPNRGAEMWFYAAADHIFEMQIPWFLPPMQRRMAKKFREKVLSLRLPIGDQTRANWEDVEWAINSAKTLLRMFDATLLIKSEKGEWE